MSLLAAQIVSMVCLGLLTWIIGQTASQIDKSVNSCVRVKYDLFDSAITHEISRESVKNYRYHIYRINALEDEIRNTIWSSLTKIIFTANPPRLTGGASKLGWVNWFAP